MPACAAATGLAKLLDNRGFAQVIASYQLGLPGLFLLPLGLCISLAEVWIGTNSCARSGCASASGARCSSRWAMGPWRR
jgi:hypothetical protein